MWTKDLFPQGILTLLQVAEEAGSLVSVQSLGVGSEARRYDGVSRSP